MHRKLKMIVAKIDDNNQIYSYKDGIVAIIENTAMILK